MSNPSNSNKTIKRVVKMLSRVAGLPLVYIGVIVLVASYVFGWSHINAVLFTGLGFVVAGVVSYIIITKKESRY
ncbi:MAG: hypothetical protein IKW98_06515 [Prevotella sp.]|nr:hypothetical protein [Prevotella sp.]